ncbi:MAG: YdcF family protein [Deltaproteobacteria bacterium]|nr:YdcF family protein [Deltaproteobacteria bacterium]
MFVLKQFLKVLVLPPTLWLLILLAVLVFWRRAWSRKLLLCTVLVIFALHSGLVNDALRYPLESNYAPVLNPTQVGPYDAIVVLTAGITPAGGLIPFSTINQSMFRRLDEAWRLYRVQPRPIIVSGGHVNPFTPDKAENKIARDYLIRWGVPASDVLGEAKSRDTFESAVELQKLLKQKDYKRYLLVTSAVHMPRSMLVFSRLAPEPVPAPGDFSIGETELTPFSFFPNEHAASELSATLHEYLGLINYHWRVRFSQP